MSNLQRAGWFALTGVNLLMTAICASTAGTALARGDGMMLAVFSCLFALFFANVYAVGYHAFERDR